MNRLIDAAFSRGRTVILLFVIILFMGASAYISIPKESEPDIPIPTIYVSVAYEGIAPEDAERLLVRPLEKELQSIEGLKEIRAIAAEGYASVTLEFDAGFDADQALVDVREKVDIARAELPPGSEEPRITEVNVALFPVLTIGLSGDLPERSLLSIARNIKDLLEVLPGVLEVDIAGDREELLEVITDPSVLEAYNISFNELFNYVQQNNRLVAAGALDVGAGRMVFKVPGVIENLNDLEQLPVKVVDGNVITFKDVASIRRTFKDASSFARIEGKPALALEVSKRSGANIIETIAEVRDIVEREKEAWPTTVEVTYLQDKSDQIETMLGDLQNNVLTAIILVMIVIVAALGIKPALLVGFSIPGAFLAGVLVISWMGLTLNIIVLFSLILVVGMLVDGAIVTIELASRNIAAGIKPKEAYAKASKRMAWPIIASTATTLAVFVPLVFWPGVVGEFMKFLPITVIITLIASLAMALVFIPVIGGMLSKKDAERKSSNNDDTKDIEIAEDGTLSDLTGMTGRYISLLNKLLNHPGKTLLATVAILIVTYTSYGMFGRGVEFFPSIEPEFLQVQVQARGDLSIYEKDAMVREVENKLLSLNDVKTVYARTLGTGNQSQGNMPEDAVGVIQMELVNWRYRKSASELIPEIRQAASQVPGILTQVREQESGPSGGKPVQIQLSGKNRNDLIEGVKTVRNLMQQVGGFVDVEDSRPLPSIEWRLTIDRKKAAEYGADVSLLGNAVIMITNGVMLAEYRPDDAEDEVEIRLRFPETDRHINQLDRIRVPTNNGYVPISNFVTLKPAQKNGVINRTDAQRVMQIKADVEEGVLVDKKVNQMKDALKQNMMNSDLAKKLSVTFKGQDEDQQEAGAFLMNAFLVAIFLMTLILVTQFNSFYQSMLVLSAIVFSTAGILIGLLIANEPFGVVMVGIGVIALAGIVVNNNIVLIDTFNDLYKKERDIKQAILRTAAQRMRPVLLTSVTTVLGLLPMVFALTIDIVGQDILVGAPSSQWWTQLSSAIAGGLTFATLLTLLLTPCLLMLGKRFMTYKAD